MPEESEVSEIKLAPEDRRRGKTYQSVYVNHTSISVSRWDFRLLFSDSHGRKDDDEGDTVLEIEEKVELLMSPQHTKALATLLNDNIKTYEERMGPIRFLAPEDEAQLEKLQKQEADLLSKKDTVEPEEELKSSD